MLTIGCPAVHHKPDVIKEHWWLLEETYLRNAYGSPIGATQCCCCGRSLPDIQKGAINGLVHPVLAAHVPMILVGALNWVNTYQASMCLFGFTGKSPTFLSCLANVLPGFGFEMAVTVPWANFLKAADIRQLYQSIDLQEASTSSQSISNEKMLYQFS